MEKLILILIVIAIVEIILSSRWSPFYFLKGLKLFQKTFLFTEKPNLSPEDLSFRFSQGIFTPIVFIQLAENTIAFREKMLSLRLFNYTPLMHGIISIDKKHKKISITGYANWTPLAFVIIFPPVFFHQSTGKVQHGFLILFFMFLYGSIYAVQFIRFKKIVQAVKVEPSPYPKSHLQQVPIISEGIKKKIIAVIITIIVIVWVIPTVIAVVDKDLFISLNKKFYVKTTKLEPSAQKGKFIYKHSGKIEFTAEPQYPVYVFLRKANRDEPELTIVTSKDEYTIEANLTPGKYQISSSLNPDGECCKGEKYWGAYSDRIFIQEDGMAEIEEQAIIHYLKIKILSPVSKSVVTDKRPTLRWEPVPGADYYKLSWSKETTKRLPSKMSNDFGRAKVTKSEFTFRKELEPAMVYRWDVDAFNKDGDKIAYYSQPSFKTM